MRPLATDHRGNLLLDFRAGAESILIDREPSAPLPLALVAAIHEGRCLLVFDRRRQEWELPGGMLEQGETPRQAAEREFVEETGQATPALVFCGLALFELAPDRRLEYAAVFRADLDAITAFEPNDEVAATGMWDPSTDVDHLSVLDADIVRRVVARG